MYVNLLADEFAMSRIKLRKILITSGAYYFRRVSKLLRKNVRE